MLSANKVVKNAIESLFDATANVYETAETVDDYGVSQTGENLVYESIDCRISHKTRDAALNSDTIDTQTYDTVLYCPVQYRIKSGSRVTVNSEGRTFEFKNAGEPLVYRHHQEIPLVLSKERP